ncbi:RagB/SusD family nutrient uptake outer membrane protein [Galbibacter mesophilus]|uniref:RagB/SusD family nutrient uptake outer membrane protein n=1 Tax=Galbibacter mesophilus TaxID=379069 RepID=UPI00191F90B2|nr:RagB/SusD family nutrient uptake outer membrane protein [Galbibacter mesophilus]MCM5664045.1 RagB/SusD family nutrient uptake outer membrane protein [Galbibacter mesophilus]
MKYSTILILIITLSLGSCDYTDYNEKDYLLKDDIYSDLDRVKSALTGVYTDLPAGFTQVGQAMIASASDDAVFANDADPIHRYFNGAWSTSRPLDSKWNFYYPIRRANQLLDEVENYTYEERLYDKDPTYEVLMQELERYKYEARTLRAFYYFELAKRYGDIPFYTSVLTEEEANTIERTPFEEIIDFIVQECDSAAAVLPDSYIDQRDKETGRVTKGAAMAIKAKALLYAASPLHNESRSTEAWEKAAEAAYDIINSGTYSLLNNYSDVFNNYSNGNSELILERRQGNSNNFERINFPVGYVGGSSGNTPTQNLVDAYEMKDSGMNINDAGSGYDAANPYQGRDPRFEASILYNGATFKGQTIEVFNGGTNGAPQRYATPTGYYLKKYLIESINLEAPNVTEKEHTWVLFRYAEVLLNYAEAMNEAYGPESPGSFGMTALQAVNMVRARSGMPDFPSGLSKDAFRTKLRNERRVELAFEGHRFWDIRRWEIGEQTNQIYKMEVTQEGNNFSYSKELLTTRNFEPKMYLYPIPFNETVINTNLTQNPGW